MKSEEAMDFLTRIRKNLPGFENFLQATLVKEHLTKLARDELHSILRILSHIQLAALPSQGKRTAQKPRIHPPPSHSSTSNAESEPTQSLSASLGSSATHTETDTEQSVASFDSPFSSPTRTVGLSSGTAGTTTEVKGCKTECASRKKRDKQPVAVSRSGRTIKVAGGRINSDYVTQSVNRGKRRKRENSDSTQSPSPTKKHKPQPTHNLSKQHPICKHVSMKNSITNWTETTKRKKETLLNKILPQDKVPVSIN